MLNLFPRDFPQKVTKGNHVEQGREIRSFQMATTSWIPFFKGMTPFCRVVSIKRWRQTAKSIFAPQTLPRASWREKSAAGFTLIEVLMATAILAIGLMGVASVITWACVQDVRASHLSRGGFLVEEFMETATRAQYSAQAFNALTGTTANRLIEGVRYSMNCTLAENTPVERCREVTCILSWNNQGSSASARYVYVLSPKF
jgi:general secretion pathway protein I